MSYSTELAQCEATYLALKRQLADSQAENKVLRDALVNVNNGLSQMYGDTAGHNCESDYARCANFSESIVRNAITQPTDDSALKAALKAERERCAQVAENTAAGRDAEVIADEIRALGDEK